ncbi:unnamed protein product [Taenia asiatica]|uniref:Crumbs cell polarity complex component 2b n=1 Tax=Taenia asiatica TaxID=60517 RepID=A0A0R3VUP0_TAEAS|nr:unnamed protein product [Taenia asiatica]
MEMLVLNLAHEAAAAAQSPCLLNPCQNGGKCEVSKDAPGGYQCICLEPYGGHNCTIENPTCIDQPCLNGGACEDMPNQQFKCICPPDFAGLRCEFEDPCLVKPCKNGARCFSNNLGKRECQCPVGFTGEDCSVDVNECEVGERSPCEQNGTCINEPGGYRCECLNGYTGARCETLVLNCKPNPCLNGGVCDDKGDHFECLCPRVQVITFEDKDLSILDVVILVGGIAGFEGKVCEREINDCKGSPCQNGGVCEDLVDDFRCNCPPGWKGTFCEQPMLPCDSSPCLNSGVCENTPSGYVCHCPPGFNGSRCEVNIDDCVGVSCLNGGFCVDRPNAWFCHCPAGYSGRHCELHQLGPVAGGLSSTAITDSAITTCRSGKICLHNGVCIRPNAASDAIEAFCDCPLEWHGEFCEIPVCSEDACANGGRCQVLLIRPGDQTTPSKKESYCECPPGFFGEHCLEKVFSLSTVISPEFGVALHLQFSLQSYRHFKETSNICLGFVTYTMVLLTTRSLSLIQVEKCRVDLCQNGGECTDSAGGARCRCPPGFGGVRCERALRTCLETPCLNGAECVDTPLSSGRLFTCQCSSSFQG